MRAGDEHPSATPEEQRAFYDVINARTTEPLDVRINTGCMLATILLFCLAAMVTVVVTLR